MRALQEEIKSAYRMQLHRLGDLAFAEFKEKLYQQEISWKTICSSYEAREKILDDTIELSFDTVGTRKFKRTATVHSVGKKGKQDEEWRLVTFRVRFDPIENQAKFSRGKKGNKKERTFTYQTIVGKVSHSSPEPLQTQLAVRSL